MAPPDSAGTLPPGEVDTTPHPHATDVWVAGRVRVAAAAPMDAAPVGDAGAQRDGNAQPTPQPPRQLPPSDATDLPPPPDGGPPIDARINPMR